MSLDDRTIYIFVRGDLKEEDQMVQAMHAIFNMARFAYPVASGEPRIVALDGGSSEKAFGKTLRKLESGLPPAKVEIEPEPSPNAPAVSSGQFVETPLYFAYSDVDKPDWGVTAIATVPLTKEQALPLANYRLRRYSPVAQSQSAAPDASANAAEMGVKILPGEPTLA